MSRDAQCRMILYPTVDLRHFEPLWTESGCCHLATPKEPNRNPTISSVRFTEFSRILELHSFENNFFPLHRSAVAYCIDFRTCQIYTPPAQPVISGNSFSITSRQILYHFTVILKACDLSARLDLHPCVQPEFENDVGRSRISCVKSRSHVVYNDFPIRHVFSGYHSARIAYLSIAYDCASGFA